ncbi:MAG: FAD-dependent monooxygenase, partial [Pseudomonadota bacterium]
AALGLWGELEPAAGPIRHIKVTDGRVGGGPGPFSLSFDHREIGESPMGWMVEDRHLRHALLDAIGAEDAITYLPGTRVTGQRHVPGAVEVALSRGASRRAALLVGADGRASATAERVGIRRDHQIYDQTALVCAIAHSKSHDQTAYQFFVPEGPVAILPLADNRSSIVWTESTRRAAKMNALSDAAYLETLHARLGDFLGAFELAGDRYTYPLGSLIARRFVAERVALVGDAAHAMHPIAGQGLNVGLRDVAALAHVLGEAARRGQDPGGQSVLAGYERWRRLDANLLVGATDVFNRLFSNDSAMLRAIRGIGMHAVVALPALRRNLIREAAGITGELPDLMSA